MLILQRKIGEALYIGDDIKITIKEISNDKVKISIDAPRDINIVREELLLAQESNVEASILNDETVKNLKAFKSF